MQYSIRHISASRIVLATVATAGALLVFAAFASAEGLDTVVPPDPVGESPASVEPAPPPAAAAEPVDAPEPVEVTTKAVTEVASTAGAMSEAAESAPPVASVPDLPSRPPASNPHSDASLGATAAHLIRTSSEVEPDAVTLPTHRVSELAAQIGEDAPDATPLVRSSTKAVAQAIDSAPAVDQIHSLGQQALQAAGEALHHGPLALVAPDAVESSLPPAGVVGTFSHHGAPTLPSTLLTGANPYVQVMPLDSVLSRPAELGTVEALRHEAPSVGDLVVHAPFQMPADVSGASRGERVNDLGSPLSNGNSPTRAPDLGPVAASGVAGSSSFVPIVALLALLALVALAILRRLREVPDFPGPTPFVCALERPG